MFTATSKLQLDRVRHEYNAKTFEQSIVSRRYEEAAEMVSSIESEAESQCGSKSDATKALKENSDYKDLVAYESVLEEQKNNLDTELELLEKEMDTFQNCLEKGVEQSTQMWCFSS